MTKVNILMVCLGNICRSPLAEGVLRSMLDKEHFMIDSAGTASYHTGEKPDERSIIIARENGVDISKLRARTFTEEDFEKFDYIFVMDKSNYKNVIKLAKKEELKNYQNRIKKHFKFEVFFYFCNSSIVERFPSTKGTIKASLYPFFFASCCSCSAFLRLFSFPK